MAKSKQTDVPAAIPLEGKKKTECPVTRQQFLSSAKPIAVTMEGQARIASVKEFSTGSFGWSLNDKTVVNIDGVPTKVQLNLNMTVIGSKESK